MGKKGFSRLFYRAVYYMRVGASIATFPLTLSTFVRVFYPNLDLIFVFVIGCFALTTTLIGYVWLKKSYFYKAEIQIGIEANPYQIDKYPPVSIPMAEAMMQFLEKQGIDCSKVKEILERSR